MARRLTRSFVSIKYSASLVHCPAWASAFAIGGAETTSSANRTAVSMALLEDVDDEEYPIEGELLVARRALSVQAKEEDKCNGITYFILDASYRTRYVV